MKSTTPSTLLPRTPAPQPGEHFLGYALRLANTNGYRGYWPIKDLIGLKGMTPASVTRAWLSGAIDFGPLGAATDRRGGALAMSLKPRFARSHEHYRTTRPRVCPRCLAEEPYVREEWDFTPVTHCMRHLCVLVDHCIGCDRLLTWTRPHVHYCSCGFDLRNLTTVPVDSESASLLRRSGLTVPRFTSWKHRERHGERLAVLEGLVRRLYRPHDVMEASPDLNALPNRSLHRLYVTAASLRGNAQLRARWEQNRKNTLRQRFPAVGRTLSPDATGTGGTRSTKSSRIMSGNFAECSPPETSHPDNWHPDVTERQRYGVTKLRLKCAKRQLRRPEDEIQPKELDEALSRQIDLLTLSKALSISPSHLHSLREWNFLCPVHQGTPRYEEWLFDLADVDRLLTTLPARPASPTTAPIVTIADVLLQGLLDSHNTSLGRLLRAVTDGELAAFRNGVGAFECLAVDKKALGAWLIEQLEAPRDSYTMGELRDLLNVPGPVVSHLCRHGFLPIDDTVRRAREASRVAACHVEAFRARYVLLNTLARASGRHMQKLREPLDTRGILPSFEERSATGQAILLYEHAPPLVQALRGLVDSQNPEIARHLARFSLSGPVNRCTPDPYREGG